MRGARLGRLRGGGGVDILPCGGGAVAEAGSPAGERRKCRGVGAGPAPRQLLLARAAAAAGRTGGRADARSRGPCGGAGGARRG